MGDGIMVFVGAPQEHENHAEIAVRIALEMRQKVEEMRRKLDAEARDSFQIGIGIHSGFVTVGSFGTDDFRDYTIIGRTVNLASRVQGACPPGKILVTARTRALVGANLETTRFGSVALKGISDQVELFEVTGLRRGERGD
jgi:class 3 adenylate cyclase